MKVISILCVMVWCSVSVVSPCLAEPVARMYGVEFSAEELQTELERKRELATGARESLSLEAQKADIILTWAGDTIRENARSNYKVTDEEIDKTYQEFEGSGAIPSFTEEQFEFHHALLTAFEKVKKLPEFDPGAVHDIYSDLSSKVAPQFRLSEEIWNILARDVWKGNVCEDCYPTNEAEFVAANRKVVEAFLIRKAVSLDLADQLKLRQSEKLLNKASELASSQALEMKAEDALEKLLREREWDRWQTIACRNHLQIFDPTIEAEANKLIKAREEEISFLENYAFVLALPY